MRICVFTGCMSRLVFGWGADGHMIVARIAQQVVDSNVRELLFTILGVDSLASVANWADQIDHTAEFSWTKCMHYVDSEDDVCAVDYPTDCRNGCCVVSAIHNYTERAHPPDLDTHNTAEALKFLIHFYGDVHQPLHAGRKSDMGGNSIHVHTQHTQHMSNLHSVWDSLILDEFMSESKFTYNQYADLLFSKIGTYDDFRKWVGTCVMDDCPLVAAEESAQLACEFAYTNEKDEPVVNGSVLSKAYFDTRMSVIETRLAAAGVRLGTILNQWAALPSNASKTDVTSTDDIIPHVFIVFQ